MDSSRFFATPSTSASDEIHTSPLESVIAELKDQRTLIHELFERNEESKLATASCFQGIKDSFDQLLERVKGIEEKKSDESATTSAPTKTSTKCPKELSSALKKLYSNVEDDQLRFNVEKNYTDSVNQKIADFYSDQLQKEYGSSYNKLQISKAVYRYYQSRRRTHKDSMPDRTEQKLINERKTKRTQRQRNLFKRRGKCLKKAREREYWQMINHEYMSEESSGEEEGCSVFKVYSPSWRSDSLSNLIKRLDRRMENSDKSTPKRIGFLRYKRIESDKLDSSIPTSAPLWTYKRKSNTDAGDGPAETLQQANSTINTTTSAAPSVPSVRERQRPNIDIFGQKSQQHIYPGIQAKSSSSLGRKQSVSTPKSHQTRPHTYGNNISTLRQGIQCTISPSLVNRILDRDEPTEDFGDDDSSDWSITD